MPRSLMGSVVPGFRQFYNETKMIRVDQALLKYRPDGVINGQAMNVAWTFK